MWTTAVLQKLPAPSAGSGVAWLPVSLGAPVPVPKGAVTRSGAESIGAGRAALCTSPGSSVPSLQTVPDQTSTPVEEEVAPSCPCRSWPLRTTQRRAQGRCKFNLFPGRQKQIRG